MKTVKVHGVIYFELEFNSRDHEYVSRQWFTLLWDLAHHDKVHFNVNEGHRTMARQQQLVNELGLYDPVRNPHGAAKPSPTAPHIKEGCPNHAIDVDNAQSVIDAALKRGVTLSRTVRTESWHLEPNAIQLARYYKKNWARVNRERLGKKIKHVVKPSAPAHASNALVDFVAAWEGEKLTAYKVPGESFYTIGVGHTGKVNGKPIHAGMKISRATSRKLLRADLKTAEDEVKKLVPEHWRRKQQRFDTMVSLAFNMGSDILSPAPPLTSFGVVLKKKVTRATVKQAVAAIQLYNKGGNPLRIMPGLVKRRRAEGILFEKGKYLHGV